MRHDEIICASLPMTQVSFTAWYCHAHQAWYVRTSVSTQTGEDQLTVHEQDDVSLGPFDGLDALLVLATDVVARGDQIAALRV